MRFHAVYRRLYFWLGSALVALMDAPPRFWGRPTWRSDPSQGTPKTKNSSDLAHYFFGSGPKSRTKIKIYKKENKEVRLQVPGSSWKPMVSPVGP